MTTITQVIDAITTTPDIADPTTFEAKTNTLLNEELPALQTQLNTWRGQANTVAGEVNTNAGTAAAAASTATTKAGEAAASEAVATTKRNEAVDAANSAAALFEFFDDRCLGAKAADPATDNDGDPLVDGAWYINSVSGALRAYTAAGGWVQGIAALAGVESINGQAGAVVLNLPGLDFSLYQQGVI